MESKSPGRNSVQEICHLAVKLARDSRPAGGIRAQAWLETRAIFLGLRSRGPARREVWPRARAIGRFGFIHTAAVGSVGFVATAVGGNFVQGLPLNVPPEVTEATLGGRTPEQLVGVSKVLCLASHNVGPNWDKLNLNDSEEDGSEGDIHYDFGPSKNWGYQSDFLLGDTYFGFSTVGDVVGSYGVLERLRVSGVPQSMESLKIRASGAPPSMESPELEIVSSLGHE
ncbi:hypothetical protein TIFTF001_032583 [Ficus carica]|uniref:Uncharacterized protein n=1 Tax=Ficus carica TaxID=3494 RepID=A0AA88DWY9_FICCA|nr:hypothetical protein TIFTF001_032583 [Ficus carica]